MVIRKKGTAKYPKQIFLFVMGIKGIINLFRKERKKGRVLSRFNAIVKNR